jgi:hypothetical protein
MGQMKRSHQVMERSSDGDCADLDARATFDIEFIKTTS